MKSKDEYKDKLYKEIKISLFKDREVLDVGCGDGEDAYNISKFAKRVSAFDIVRSDKWKKYKKKNLNFKVADAQNIPSKSNQFDGVFLKDVLHHVKNPEKVLEEIDRVSKKGAVIILVEGNRYNPLFYIHMTKMRGHEHLAKETFKRLVRKRFKNVKFYYFESHFHPNKFIKLVLDVFSVIMKNTPILNKFLSYNVAVIIK